VGESISPSEQAVAVAVAVAEEEEEEECYDDLAFETLLAEWVASDEEEADIAAQLVDRYRTADTQSSRKKHHTQQLMWEGSVRGAGGGRKKKGSSDSWT
jgi:hypothetical protein